jgi:pilus assembly protein CpaE
MFDPATAGHSWWRFGAKDHGPNHASGRLTLTETKDDGTNPKGASGSTLEQTVKVFVSEQESKDVIQRAFHDLGVKDAIFTTGNVQTAAAALAKESTPRLLIVDLSGADDPIAYVNELAERCEPEVSVLAIGDRNDIILYRDLKAAGVFEYFFKPLALDLMKRACASALTGTLDLGVSRKGKLVLILGVRGGVGATTIATGAAWRLSTTKRRWVMLVDLDLQTGDAALQLDAEPSHALFEALENPGRVDKLFLERGKIHATPRLDLLASLEPLSAPFVLNVPGLLSLLDTLLSRYRFVFLDVPPTVALLLKEVLRLPGVRVLISNATLASAREVVRWSDFIGPNSPDRSTLHILNMSGADGGLSEEEFVRATGRKPDIVIPYDREIAAASNLGVKGMQKCAALNLGLALLLREVAGEPVETQQSLFKRIFG